MKSILFVHRNFPAQFGHIAERLVNDYGYRIAYASEAREGVHSGVQCIRVPRCGPLPDGLRAEEKKFLEYSRWSEGLRSALRTQKLEQPDVIVGHCGLGPIASLRDVFNARHIQYFEWYYGSYGTDIDFLNQDFVPDHLRQTIVNSPILSELSDCDAGYTPSEWQMTRLPDAERSKVKVLFDGIDTNFWMPAPAHELARSVFEIPKGAKLLTFVARGLEPTRGFDMFLSVARRLLDRNADLYVACIGADEYFYRSRAKTGEKSLLSNAFEVWGLDSSRFIVPGFIERSLLRQVFWRSDAHVYLTAPLFAGWSLYNALACGCLVVGSDTPPVREVITNGYNGLLVDFHDVGAMCNAVEDLIRSPMEFKHLRANAVRHIREKFSLECILPQFIDLCESACVCPAIEKKSIVLSDKPLGLDYRAQGISETVATVRAEVGASGIAYFVHDADRLAAIAKGAGTPGWFVIGANGAESKVNGLVCGRVRVDEARSSVFVGEAETAILSDALDWISQSTSGTVLAVIDWEYNSAELRTIIKGLVHMPELQGVIGRKWSWWGVRREVKVAMQRFKTLTVYGEVWSLR